MSDFRVDQVEWPKPAQVWVNSEEYRAAALAACHTLKWTPLETGTTWIEYEDDRLAYHLARVARSSPVPPHAVALGVPLVLGLNVYQVFGIEVRSKTAANRIYFLMTDDGAYSLCAEIQYNAPHMGHLN